MIRIIGLAFLRSFERSKYLYKISSNSGINNANATINIGLFSLTLKGLSIAFICKRRTNNKTPANIPSIKCLATEFTLVKDTENEKTPLKFNIISTSGVRKNEYPYEIKNIGLFSMFLSMNRAIKSNIPVNKSIIDIRSTVFGLF